MQLCFLCFFPKPTGIFLPDVHCEQQNCRQDEKKKPARLSPPLCSCLFGGVTTAASHEGTVWTCVQRAQGLGKLHMISKLPKWKPLNMNYSAMWHCHPWVTEKEKLYEYRHNNTDNEHNYSMIIQALPFYIVKQSLRLTLFLSPWYLSGIPEKELLSFVSIDNQSF